MGESLLTALSMENHHPSTLLSMDPVGIPLSSSSPDDRDRELLINQHHQQRNHHSNNQHVHQQQQQQQQMVVSNLSLPPDINLPLSVDRSSPPNSWGDPCDISDVGFGPHSVYEAADASASIAASLSKPTKICSVASMTTASCPQSRKIVKRGDSIWGAWFFFNFYFKPVLSEKSKSKVSRDVNGVSGFDKSDLRLDVFLVQHDMENMYMWVFKERPDNALGKMQLRSYMNGHSRLGEPQFPFSADKGFVRSHRMQRKQYRGLSNPQCVHGIELVRSPNLAGLSEADRKKWVELTGRELNFSIPPDASDYGSWRNLSTEFELERPPPPVKTGNSLANQRKLLNGSGLNLATQPSSNYSGSDGMDLSPTCKRKKGGVNFLPNPMDEDCCLHLNPFADRSQELDNHPVEPAWLHEFSGVMRHAYGPVTAAKTIYEDDEGYLIMVSLPFSDQQRVKVSWKNCLTHGVVKISCYSTARMPYIKRHDRTFKLTDTSPEHCPPGELVREIPLATRIPEDGKLEAYYDETGTVLEIMVPKHREGPEEHEVRVCMRPPHLGANELLLS